MWSYPPIYINIKNVCDKIVGVEKNAHFLKKGLKNKQLLDSLECGAIVTTAVIPFYQGKGGTAFYNATTK